MKDGGHYKNFLFSVDALDSVSTEAGRKENKAKLANLQQHELVVNQYKDIIHEQVGGFRVTVEF